MAIIQVERRNPQCGHVKAARKHTSVSNNSSMYFTVKVWINVVRCNVVYDRITLKKVGNLLHRPQEGLVGDLSLLAFIVYHQDIHGCKPG